MALSEVPPRRSKVKRDSSVATRENVTTRNSVTPAVASFDWSSEIETTLE